MLANPDGGRSTGFILVARGARGRVGLLRRGRLVPQGEASRCVATELARLRNRVAPYSAHEAQTKLHSCALRLPLRTVDQIGRGKNTRTYWGEDGAWSLG